MNTYIEHIPASPILFMRRTGPYGEGNYLLMQQMKEWISAYDLWKEGGVVYGIAQDDMTNTPPDQCRYDVCYATETQVTDNAICRGTLPSGKYLVFTIPHTSEEVQRFWTSIGSALAQENRLLDETRPILERYQPTLVENGWCEFCVPVI
jgi:DNA gyrase inhibitor GyrI